MKGIIKLNVLILSCFLSLQLSAEDTLYKPFVVASETEGALAEVTEGTLTTLTAAGFEVVGQYSPINGTEIIVVTNEHLKTVAGQSTRGGYAAGQRISLTESEGTVTVSFMNPLYLQYAYRLEGDLQPVYDALSDSIGAVSTCGGGDKKMTAKKLKKYHYMFGMQYFDDPSKLGEFDSHEDAVSAVENGLAKADDALTQIYRIDIPNTDQTVFGVGMKMTNDDEEDLDSKFQMGVVDFEGCRKHAYFPYEVLVKGNKIEALHMRFRMAVHFPDLSMMGSHGFTKLMSAPGAIEDALEEMVNSN